MVGITELPPRWPLWPFSRHAGAPAPLDRENFGEVMDGCGCFAELADTPQETDRAVEGER